MANLYFRQFVTLDQVKARLRIDNDDEDLDLTDLIQSCTAVITNYLKVPDIYADSTGEIPTDSNGDPLGIPPEVQLATLLLIGIMYRDRDGADMAQWQQGYLPWQVTACIYQLRDPAMA